MQELGSSRSVRSIDHMLQTPETFVYAPLPGMKGATAVVHISPANGAAFAMYTAVMEMDGALGPPAGSRFVYVLEGEIQVGAAATLDAGGYAFVPAAMESKVTSLTAGARVVVIEKPYVAVEEFAVPEIFVGRERDVAATALMGDEDLQVRALLPGDAAFDFAVNTMEYQPGAALSMVEMHVMEHGLVMLQGGGIYRLNERWYPVSKGDVIWMGPYCPQWFGALGKEPAKYLIYKDWNRHPLVPVAR